MVIPGDTTISGTLTSTQLGINTLTPGFTLDVNGTTNITGNLTTTLPIAGEMTYPIETTYKTSAPVAISYNVVYNLITFTLQPGTYYISGLLHHFQSGNSALTTTVKGGSVTGPTYFTTSTSCPHYAFCKTSTTPPYFNPGGDADKDWVSGPYFGGWVVGNTTSPLQEAYAGGTFKFYAPYDFTIITAPTTLYFNYRTMQTSTSGPPYYLTASVTVTKYL